MKSCLHASYCPRRMRDGDRPDGCSSVDQRTCTPSLESHHRPADLHARIAERYLFTMFNPGDKS